jgi:hypothetical protein
VPSTGFEPAHSFELHPLKMACLPISPTGQFYCKYNKKFRKIRGIRKIRGGFNEISRSFIRVYDGLYRFEFKPENPINP